MIHNKKPFTRLFIVLAIFLCGYQNVYVEGTQATTAIPLKGTASGGTLVIGNTLNRNAKFVSIETNPGETADVIVNRLAEAIAYSNSIFSFHRYSPEVDRENIKSLMASGSTLNLPGRFGSYFLAGTENGLGIPKPPLSLSCSYDNLNDKVILRWINPPGAYDSIAVILSWSNYDRKSGRLIDGKSNSYVINRAEKDFPVDIDDLDVWLLGNKNDIPSAPVAIHLSNNGRVQEELFGIPFSGGIMPNWSAYESLSEAELSFLEQGDKYSDLICFNPIYGLRSKPFYQIIKAPSKDGVYGIYRKFLGLTPGNTYRIIANLSTLSMDKVQGSWSFSLCANHNGPDGKDLDVQQLLGVAPLPSGRGGLDAGRKAFYTKGKVTKGETIIVSGDESLGGPNSSHITLPPGVNTITVWVRFVCDDQKGEVAFAGVKIEDITAIENPDTPLQILQKENAKEDKLIDRERIKRQYRNK